MKVSLEEQVKRLAMAQQKLGAEGETLIAPALKTLEWLNKNKATLDLVVRTVQSDSVRHVMEVFPGATIERIGWSDDDDGHTSQDY